jgi:TRAP-type mannitol/chloroaromatic compound transport system substrate-binding protein
MTKISSIILLFVLCSLAFALGYHLKPNHNQTPSETSATPTKTFQWKMVTTWPPNFPILQEGVEQLSKDLEIMSGRLKVKVFAGGELVPPIASV